MMRIVRIRKDSTDILWDPDAIFVIEESFSTSQIIAKAIKARGNLDVKNLILTKLEIEVQGNLKAKKVKGKKILTKGKIEAEEIISKTYIKAKNIYADYITAGKGHSIILGKSNNPGKLICKELIRGRVPWGEIIYKK